jgi:cytochrome c-type biogenesis protein CcmE
MALNLGSQITIGVVVVGAFAVLVFSAPKEGVLEYVYVDRVVEAPQDFAGREFKVHGNVVEGSLRQELDSGDYHFVIEFKGKRLKVIYDELLPDTFAEGGEVVLTGTLDGEVLRSSEMSAKCPSKYEEVPGGLPAS